MQPETQINVCLKPLRAEMKTFHNTPLCFMVLKSKAHMSTVSWSDQQDELINSN